MEWHDLYLTFLAFFSEVVGTVSGFGSSTFFVPLATFFEGIQLVLALTAILHCFGNSFRMILFRKYFAWPIFLKLFLPSVIFTGFGALLTTQVSTTNLRFFLGALLILLPLIIYFVKRRQYKIPPAIAFMLSAFSGFTTGLVGTGGAVRGLALSTLNIEKNVFVVLSTSIDFGGDVLRAGIYIANGFISWNHWFYIPLLGAAAYLGTRVGQKILARVNQYQFDLIVYGFIIISGIALLAGGSQ